MASRNPRTLGQLLYSLRNGSLLLPNFQRPFVWNAERWQSLMASILLEYPVGQALIGTDANSHLMSVRKPLSIPEKKLHDLFLEKANLKQDDVKTVEINQYLQKGESYQCEYLLDGQQRLTALDLMLGNAYHFSGNELSRNHRIRWFLDLQKLGLNELQWFNIREMQHESAIEVFVSLKYLKKDKNSPCHFTKKDSDLCAFLTTKNLQEKAGLEESIYLPLDRIYCEDHNSKSLEFDSTFIIDFFEERQDVILNQTSEGKRLKEKRSSLGDEKYQEERKQLRRKFLHWRSKLEAMLNSISAFEFPVLEVPSQEFDRLAGIFSVINMGGVELSTFDLLVAKTTTVESSLRDVVKLACSQSFNSLKKSVNLLPVPEKNNNIEDFWQIGHFLGEKNEDRVNQGEEFPESIARSFAQTIVLHAKLSKALGDDWSTRSNSLGRCRENKKEPDWLNNPSPEEAARSILRLDDWGYSDKLILSLSRQEVQNVQTQAATQLLRAYFFMKASLGIVKLSYFPYRQMDLLLATVLTDSVWKKLNRDPTGTVMKKLQWWYWGSIFGGAYQKAHSSIDKRVLADIPRLLAYLSKPTIAWNDVSNLWNEEETQFSWKGSELDNSHFTEMAISGSNGKRGNRFEIICDADGYSTKDALMTSANKTMGLAILAFTIRSGLPDFKCRDKNNNELRRGNRLHTGRKDLQMDHLYAVKSWHKFTGEDIDRNSDHPINSPLNYSWISSDANRYWSDHPSFLKLELQDALNGDQDSIDFLHHHLLSVEAVEKEYKDILLSSEEKQKKSAKEVLKVLLDKRFEKLRQKIKAENPELIS